MDDHFEESVKTRATQYHNLVHFATLKMITRSSLSNSVPLARTGYAHMGLTFRKCIPPSNCLKMTYDTITQYISTQAAPGNQQYNKQQALAPKV